MRYTYFLVAISADFTFIMSDKITFLFFYENGISKGTFNLFWLTFLSFGIFPRRKKIRIEKQRKYTRIRATLFLFSKKTFHNYKQASISLR